ncbi:NAD(P)H:quinone oxidoreductase [Alteromonas ponticola]|uniref:NAD(P)H:quinone oxidoreductase n=1 Tax=Alteromonas aquimaris TaxID=2998417 RepID=A0ABT3P5R8_9ALTE|nr:NAD(P)H:quinone oxidoreductase [Alteromonas aquimaris]MCW8108123.1 NAD(P)H:quinone oxidoreductase [Alteromonas aquimaris]
MNPILVLYYSRYGSTKKLAEAIVQGIESADMPVLVRTVPSLTQDAEPVDQSGMPPEVSIRDFERCSGLALGSPTRFGNMAAPLKHFLDSTSQSWLKGAMINKPCCVFTSTNSMHGGQESTLLSMMLPLLHHGMVYCGVPYSEPALHETRTGGSPYGVSHVAFDNNSELSEHERTLSYAQGKRLAELAKKLY